MLDIKLKLKPGHTSERSWMDPSPLRTLFWDVTYACDFRCQICFTDSGKPHPEELSTKEALETMRKAHEAGIRDILISGGEPFLRPDLAEILSYMGNLGITARIASNGASLTENIIEKLRSETLTKSFQISLDTVDPNLYAELHGAPPGTLQTVLANLDRIQEAGFHTTISVRLTPQTLPGIPELLDLASQRGWPTVTVHCPIHTKRVQGSYRQDEDVFSLLVPVFEHFCAMPQHWLMETYIPWAEYHPVIRKFAKRIRVVNRGCRAGRDRLTLSPTGWLSPCVCLDVEEAYAGNVRTESLQDAFLNSPACDILRHPEKYGICADCPNVKKCGGGCRAAAFALSRRLDAQDKSCPVWKQRAKKENITRL
jgi:radical SAM protein with 4Fe4S-binding SPASM domain